MRKISEERVEELMRVVLEADGVSAKDKCDLALIVGQWALIPEDVREGHSILKMVEHGLVRSEVSEATGMVHFIPNAEMKAMMDRVKGGKQ